jgi:hypothetical protein
MSDTPDTDEFVPEISIGQDTFKSACLVPDVPPDGPRLSAVPEFRVWTRAEIEDAIRNKPIRRREQFAGAPWLDDLAFFDRIAKAADLDPTTLKLSPEEMAAKIVAQAQLEQAAQPQQEKPAAGKPKQAEAAE